MIVGTAEDGLVWGCVLEDEVIGSLQPNQPGVLQVDVVVVVVVVVVSFVAVVVVVLVLVGSEAELSSRQPHQPGVLQVAVRVEVVGVVVVVKLQVDDDVVSV